MKVRDLIKELLNCNMDSEVIIQVHTRLGKVGITNNDHNIPPNSYNHNIVAIGNKIEEIYPNTSSRTTDTRFTTIETIFDEESYYGNNF